MAKLSDIDKKFPVESKVNKDDIVFYDVCNEPFKIYGLMKSDDECNYFRRIRISHMQKN